MGAAFSQPGCRQEDEDEWILRPDSAVGVKAARYSSTGSSRSCSCMPREGRFVICPTCSETHPGRKLSVFLAVLICLVAASSTVFFLFPRSIAVHPAGLNSSTVAVDKADIHLNITNILNISNSNYYPITVTRLTTEVLHLSLVVGQVSNKLLLHIGPLASEQMFYAVASRIWDENTYKICTWLKIKVHHVLLHIQGTLTYSYLSHSEQLVFQSYEYVDCRGNTSLPHPLIPRPP